jgi:hypothetical protein
VSIPEQNLSIISARPAHDHLEPILVTSYSFVPEFCPGGRSGAEFGHHAHGDVLLRAIRDDNMQSDDGLELLAQIMERYLAM